MKKWIIGIVVFTGILVSSIYILIPAKVTVSSIISVDANLVSCQRFLSEKTEREKWWPAEDDSAKINSAEDVSYYQGHLYKVPMELSNSTAIMIGNGERNFISNIIFIQHAADTTLIQWQCPLEMSGNPLKRIREYADAKKLKQNMDSILIHFKKFMDVPEKVYNLNIVKTKVKDTLLITTKKIFKQMPSTAEVYALITNLKNYIAKNGAAETNSPMLNVNTESEAIVAMVAIPINKEIKANNEFEIKRMVPGDILVGEVHGGEVAVKKAIADFDTYIADYKLSMPAISFQSLVTDRMQVADTSRWVTKLYYPVR